MPSPTTEPPGTLRDWACALAMTTGRGPAARAVADLAELGSTDVLVDVGCGPGTAAREAARRGAAVTGVDPSPAARRLARCITSLRRIRNVTFVDGTAESLPLPDGSATVLWSLSAYHHWTDHATGLAEAMRVLAPGGRLLVVEPAARAHGTGQVRVTGDRHGHGLCRYGITEDGVGALASALGGAGFGGVRTERLQAGRRGFVAACASKPAA